MLSKLSKVSGFVQYLCSLCSSSLQNRYQMFLLKRHFPDVSFEDGVQIKSPARLMLGNNIQIQKNCIIHCGGMNWCDGKGAVVIGENSVLSPNCVIYGGGGVEIGRNFDCGPGVGIFSSRSLYEEFTDYNSKHLFAPVKIGDNVICYANVVISPGVEIGDGAVIAAGSVVIRDVEPYSLVGGVPAKLIQRSVRQGYPKA